MGRDPNSASTGIEFLLNGRPVSANGLPPQTTLLDFLRLQGLTGAKEGCAEGECGACTVLMVRECGSGSVYVPMNSCLIFLPMAAGQEIYTVESLAEGGPMLDAQRAMAEAGGSQCGYCTPGFVMSLFAEQYRPGREGPCDVHALGGNLCRCTGYRPIRDAALSLGPAPADRFSARLAQPAPALGAASYEGFSRPATLADCLALLAEHPDARLVAGGTDLCVESILRGRRFPHLISVEALAELREFRESADETEIGAGLTLSEIAGRWSAAPAVWNEWLPLFASPLIRNRATLGGNLATASPIGDSAPLLLALDAAVRIAGPRGLRTVPLSEFFLAYRRTALAPGEVLVSIAIPKPLPSRARFFKVAKRQLDDISTVAACFAMDIDSRGVIRHARLAYGGVAPVPLRATAAEESLIGARWNEFAVHRAQDILARTLHPISDHRGSAAYRLALAQNLLEKFWWEQQVEAAA
jgi:xanthine dehydrogenase small subunit